ncbi:hypothetical protein A3D09_02580 [Candidatus Collierbacteria bacterium RIFCSPHIGHO2_02_FULL_49_10]|uniref:DUF5667 domain-containing protein n=2 Tax=Candidatus Collieribacteriota TaxID=1752725 RepID=A0A1F5EW18_9BACT|nr:MAG: hypothetical protein A3D09_02580 [Candidatus Collierbacteria bacterium RIFCSPHIGHO2_02_FULL_49_10]OGD71966.1 MAG: hypothetical protein A2703_00435 [Candidatus Collierbacteria bacterium RIFCSPHIGHO2_01_FULL_50_25]
MKKFFLFVILTLPIFLGLVQNARAQNTHLSDYQYQLDQYRRYYAEYSNFKADYLARPTLDNEQKAIISAKQAINARELAWASFVLVLSDTVSDTGVSYPVIDKAVADLAEIAKYHFGQAVAAGSIVTRADLTAFTKNELKITAGHKLVLTQAQVAGKLARLIKFQIDAKMAYDSILPKLETIKDEVSVQNGLDQIQTGSQQINDQISALAKKTTDLNMENFSRDTFYTNSTETLTSIRTNVGRLVNVIIDLDTNYVRH